MTAGIIFIENYVAGGSDQLARLLLRKLPFSSLTVMVNQNNDMAILLSGTLPPHVTVERYGLLTIPELLNFAKVKTTGPFRKLYWVVAHLLRYPLFIFSIFYFLIRITKIKATVFVANNGGYPGGDYCRSATIAASFIPLMKVFHVVHSTAVPSKKLTTFIEWVIDRTLDNRCRLITVCRAAADELKSHRWIKQDAEVIYNGIEDARLGYENQSAEFGLRILNVGYFDHNKNQQMLLCAVVELVRRGIRDIKVVFAGADSGDGSLERCMELTRKFCIVDYVKFVGFVTDMNPLYKESDVLVLCSHREGMPMSILEAMRSGKAVVATDVGGIGELIFQGANGFVVPANNHIELANRLELFAIDRTLIARCGLVGRAIYERNFTAMHMEQHYSKVLGLEVIDAD